MGVNTANLAALIGSRICHDLISPIGAITNGLELMEMTGTAAVPERDLIAESVDHASARIRFFRIAFGMAGSQGLSATEVAALMADMSRGARVSVTWDIVGDQPRDMVRLAFLAIQCCECALTQGGRISVTCVAGKWTVSGMGPQVSVDPALWATLSGSSEADLTPALVQFGLLPDLAKQAQRTVRVLCEQEQIDIRF